MDQIISVTEAARNFSDLINRVYYQRQSYLLTRSGAVVAQLTGVAKRLTGAELAQRWKDRPVLDAEDALAWADELAILQAEMPLPEDAWVS